MLSSQLLVSCGLLLLTAVLSIVVRSFALAQMRRIAGTKSAGDLHPAELAYLMRPNDSSHCLIVLLVDTVQKGLKAQVGSTADPAAPPALSGATSGSTQLTVLKYENIVWGNVKDYIKDWSVQKAKELIPELKSKNPVKIISGIWRFRLWLWNAATGLLDEIVKDPRHIRKYFSPFALLRLFVSVAGQGVKEKLATDLKDKLLEKELLVSEKRRASYAALFSCLALVQFAAAAAIIYMLSGLQSMHVFALLFAAGVNGIVMRILLEIPSFLPFYGDIAQVIDLVKKKGFRISLLRAVMRLSRGLYWNLLAIVSLLVFLLQAALASLIFSSPFFGNLLAIVAVSLNFASMAELFLLSFRVANTEQLSAQGQTKLLAEHEQIQKVKLTDLLSTALSSPDYNQDLSELVAVYGVETLFLIAEY